MPFGLSSAAWTDKVFWWAHLDSNQGPTDYESAALTAELWALTWPSTILHDRALCGTWTWIRTGRQPVAKGTGLSSEAFPIRAGARSFS